MATTDDELLALADKYSLTVCGIHTKDRLPRVLGDGFYIFNIGSASSGGTHWTAALKRSNRVSVYFDSFGAPPPVEIESRLKDYCFNNWVIQDTHSQTCGQFVIAFGMHMSHWSHGDILEWANKFINKFGENTKENQAILARLRL